MSPTPWTRVLAGVLLATVLTSCGGAESSEDDASEGPAAPAGGRLEAALPAELQQTWLTELSRQEIRADMAAAGFGRYADDFFVSEKLGATTTMAVTFHDDSFEVTYLNPDGSWQVGWKGPATNEDATLTLSDDYWSVRDSYVWSVSGDRLTLDFARTTGDLIRNIPSEAYSRAYFSRPLRAVDCEPGDLDACL